MIQLAHLHPARPQPLEGHSTPQHGELVLYIETHGAFRVLELMRMAGECASAGAKLLSAAGVGREGVQVEGNMSHKPSTGSEGIREYSWSSGYPFGQKGSTLPSHFSLVCESLPDRLLRISSFAVVQRLSME